MINLRARRKYFFYSIIRWLTTAICSLPVVVYGLVCFITSLVHKTLDITSNQMLLIYLSIPAVVVNLFFIIFGSFYQKKLKKDVVYEFYEIVTSAKLPESLPKVVYVYTCHNDMMEARVLQNSMQTYKNIEVWISEGSEKPEVIESSRKFAKEHGFNFYAMGGAGSNNKAENLNAFLKNACPAYDYLLITDADEALDKNFVEYAIRCFYSRNFKNLGYVSPLNYVYETKNLFTNASGNFDSSDFYKKQFARNILQSNMPNLLSASCLISKKLILSSNGFPESCLEDVWLESIALRNGFSSVIIPICPCGQSFDKNIDACFKRTMRVYDWTVKLTKEQKFTKYNEKYTNWFQNILNECTYPILLLTILSILSLFVWLLVSYPQQLIKNSLFIFLLICTVLTTATSLLCRLVDSTSRSTLNKLGWLSWLLRPLHQISSSTQKLKHWFLAFVCGKYSRFGGSNQKNKIVKKNKFAMQMFVGLLITSIIIISLTLIFTLKIGFANPYVNLGFIIPITFVSYFWLSFSASIILHLFGLCSNNKNYDQNEYVYPRQFYKFEKIKKQFIRDKIADKNYDLKVLKK